MTTPLSYTSVHWGTRPCAVTTPLSYTSVHWGTRPDRALRARIPRGPFREVDRLRAISYVTTKDRPSVWRHEFDRVAGRYPWLLVADPAGGTVEVAPPPRDAIEIGRVVDFETSAGVRIHVAHVLVVTDRQGSGIWLASPYEVPYAVEMREGKPYVTRHGIEG